MGGGEVWARPGEGRSFVEGLEVLTRLPPQPSARPPILCVHGAGHGAWCWDEHWLPAAAARGWACHAVSVRGHGASGGAPGRLGDYLEDVRQVLVRLPRPPVLVGHSMGGLLVSRLLAAYPAPAGVLVATPGPRHGLGFGARVLRRHPLDYLRGLALRPPAPRADYLFSPALDPAVARRHAERMVPESAAALLAVHGPRRPRPSRAPVLVLGGGSDAVIPVIDVVRTARHYGTRAHLFPGMGHDLMLDAGWEAPLRLLLDWLERTVVSAA